MAVGQPSSTSCPATVAPWSSDTQVAHCRPCPNQLGLKHELGLLICLDLLMLALHRAALLPDRRLNHDPDGDEAIEEPKDCEN